MLNKVLLSTKENECSALQKCFLRKTTTIQQTKEVTASHQRYNFAYLCEDILFIQHGLNGHFLTFHT